MSCPVAQTSQFSPLACSSTEKQSVVCGLQAVTRKFTKCHGFRNTVYSHSLTCPWHKLHLLLQVWQSLTGGLKSFCWCLSLYLYNVGSLKLTGWAGMVLFLLHFLLLLYLNIFRHVFISAAHTASFLAFVFVYLVSPHLHFASCSLWPHLLKKSSGPVHAL